VSRVDNIDAFQKPSGLNSVSFTDL